MSSESWCGIEMYKRHKSHTYSVSGPDRAVFGDIDILCVSDGPAVHNPTIQFPPADLDMQYVSFKDLAFWNRSAETIVHMQRLAAWCGFVDYLKQHKIQACFLMEIACENNQAAAVSYLTEKGVMDDYFAYPHEVAMILSIKFRCIEIMEMLAPKCRDMSDFVPEACCEGHIPIVKFVLDRCRDEINSFLRTLCLNGHLAAAQFVESEGATDFTGALEDACLGARLDVVEWLLTKDITSFDEALGNACASSNSRTTMEIIKLMIEKGARSFDHGLHNACFYGNEDAMEYMIQQGSTDFNNGLYCASYCRDPKIARRMIELGANNLNDCLVHACSARNLDVVKLLVDRGADGFENALDEIEPDSDTEDTDDEEDIHDEEYRRKEKEIIEFLKEKLIQQENSTPGK